MSTIREKVATFWKQMIMKIFEILLRIFLLKKHNNLKNNSE
jgi:hypothetical protein